MLVGPFTYDEELFTRSIVAVRPFASAGSVPSTGPLTRNIFLCGIDNLPCADWTYPFDTLEFAFSQPYYVSNLDRAKVAAQLLHLKCCQ